MNHAQSKADQLISSIRDALKAGASDEWEAPEFEQARNLIEQWGCVWDFDGWRSLATRLDSNRIMHRPQRLGGILLNTEAEMVELMYLGEISMPEFNKWRTRNPK